MTETADINTVCSILSSNERFIRGAAYGSPAFLRPLIQLGLLRPAGTIDSIICTKCHDLHDAGVKAIGEEIGWFCPSDGFVQAKPYEVARYEICRQAIATTIQSGLQTSQCRPWPKEEPMLWTLGACELAGQVVATYFAPHLSNTEDLIQSQEYINQQARRDSALFLVADWTGSFSANWSSRCWLVPLPRVARLGEAELVFDLGYLAAGLAPCQERIAPERSGRPSLYPQSRQVILALIVENEWPARKEAKIRALQGKWREMFPYEKPPGRTAASEHIDRCEADLPSETGPVNRS